MAGTGGKFLFFSPVLGERSTVSAMLSGYPVAEVFSAGAGTPAFIETVTLRKADFSAVVHGPASASMLPHGWDHSTPVSPLLIQLVPSHLGYGLVWRSLILAGR